MLGLTILAVVSGPAAASSLMDVNHIIIVYLENRSFDHLYGLFPGADGLDDTSSTSMQVDQEGRPYESLPPVLNTDREPAAPDPRFPRDLQNRPFAIDAYVPMDQAIGDPVHRFRQEQMQIDSGRMDKFAAYSGAGALPMGYYDGSKMKLWQWAKRFTLADHFFHAAFGGSVLNHFFLICACAPRYENAPRGLGDKVTPDGYVVNNMEPWSRPHRPKADPAKLMPPQDMRTIGDALSAKGIDWAWYAGNWNEALAGSSEALTHFHPQPFVYFRNYGEGTLARRKHLKDGSDFEEAIMHGDLPPVAFYKPASEFDEHSGYAEITAGDTHVDGLLHAIEASSIWHDTVIIVTYDENGGFWDHLPPPKIDRWGPGTRVPTLVLSPFAKKGFVDHTVYDTTSILRLIEKRFGLEPLGSRDRDAGDLTHAFDF